MSLVNSATVYLTRLEYQGSRSRSGCQSRLLLSRWRSCRRVDILSSFTKILTGHSLHTHTHRALAVSEWVGSLLGTVYSLIVLIVPLRNYSLTTRLYTVIHVGLQNRRQINKTDNTETNTTQKARKSKRHKTQQIQTNLVQLPFTTLSQVGLFYNAQAHTGPRRAA